MHYIEMHKQADNLPACLCVFACWLFGELLWIDAVMREVDISSIYAGSFLIYLIGMFVNKQAIFFGRKYVK